MSAEKPATGSGRQAVGHPIDVASGVLFEEFEDYVVPGRLPLTWGRRYSSALLGKSAVGMFGPGWASPYETRLTRDLDGYSLVAPDGETVVTFDDTKGRVESGETVRNLGAFHELRREGELLAVIKWNPEEHEVERFLFERTASEDEYRLCRKESADGQAIDVVYDCKGRIDRLRQRREGRAYLLIYDDCSRVTQLRVAGRAAAHEPIPEHGEPPGRLVWRYCYDQNGRLAEAFDALEQRCGYDYDETGRLIREVSPAGMVYHFRYDEDGRCVESTGLDGFARTSLKIDRQAHLTQVWNSLDQVTTYVWNQRGQVEQKILPLGNKSHTEFDEHGRITRQIMPSGGAAVYEYDEGGDLCSLTEPTGARTQYEHDDRHLLVALVDPAGFRWERSFCPEGRLVTASDPTGARVTYSYNALGDPIAVTKPNGHVQRYDWDNAGTRRTAIDPLGHVTRYEYDSEGLLCAVVDQVQSRFEFRRDALGRTVEVRMPDGATRRFAYHPTNQITQFVDENGGVIRWRYLPCGLLNEEINQLGTRVFYHWDNEPGLLKSVTNENGERYCFEYDPNGRVLRKIDFSGRETRYKYDRDGNINAVFDAASHVTKYKRDASGALLETDYFDGSKVKLAYDIRGLLIRAENSDVVVERDYDAVGRVTRERQGEVEVYSEYDLAGRRVRRNSSLGYETMFEWTANDQLSALHPGTHEPILFEYEPNGANRCSYIRGGLRIEQRHNIRGRIIEQLVAHGSNLQNGHIAVGGSLIVRRQYDYDPAGNLVNVKDDHWGRTRYTYDKGSRVTSRVDESRFSEWFEYDPANNIKVRSEYTFDVVNQQARRTVRDHQYRPGNQIERIDNIRYSFDELGQLVEKSDENGTTHYKWNAQGMLSQTILPDGQTWTYKYDSLSRRIAKYGPTESTQFIWDGDAVLQEIRKIDEIEEIPINWEFRPDGFVPIGKIEHGIGYICINDINGTPRELVSIGGQTVWRASRSQFGKNIETNEEIHQIDCPIGFQGQWIDRESKLFYNRYRYYDPEVANYISSDPLGIIGGLNLFLYPRNPLRWIDPYGLSDNDDMGELVNSGFAYRSGSQTFQSLTPRPAGWNGGKGDVTLGEPKRGYSTFTTSEGMSKYQKIDISKLGPDLEARKIGEHISIVPKAGTQALIDWANTKTTANENPHPLTKQLKKAIVPEEDEKKCPPKT